MGKSENWILNLCWKFFTDTLALQLLQSDYKLLQKKKKKGAKPKGIISIMPL